MKTLAILAIFGLGFFVVANGKEILGPALIHDYESTGHVRPGDSGSGNGSSQVRNGRTGSSQELADLKRARDAAYNQYRAFPNQEMWMLYQDADRAYQSALNQAR